MSRSRGVHASALFVVGLLTAASAGAFVPPEVPSLDVDHLAAAPALAPQAKAEREAQLSGSAAWRDWARVHPGWRVQWNTRTRTPHRMAGPGAHLRGTPTAANIESLCRTFIDEHAALFGVQSQALRLAAADHRVGRWYVIFEQTERGVPVRGTRVDLRVRDGGEIQLLGSDVHRDIEVADVPAVSSKTALGSAARDLAETPADVQQELVIVAEPSGDSDLYRLAWELRFRTTEPPGAWRALVDAGDGRLLQRTNEVRWLNLSGHVSSNIEPATVGDAYEERPLRDTRFGYGAGFSSFTFTGATGDFDVSTVLTDSVDVRVRLSGRFAQVTNVQLQRVPAIVTRMLPGSPRNFFWDDSNSRASERDAYYQALVAHQTIVELDTAFTGLNYTMPVRVDIFSNDCNAFYDGFGINFYGESGRCVNTARIADVVLHEYGHGITDQVYRPFAPSGAMHEGFSDYWAATITDQPLIGRGFRGPGTILRTVDNTLRTPENLVGEPHRDGLIIAGALWDLRQSLGHAATDSLFHFARYGRADNFDDYMLDVLVVADDDDDVYNGTPRFDPIIDAFRAHGIGDYSVQIDHEPLPDTEDATKPLRVEATILSIFALDAGSLALHYRVDGGAWTSLPLAEVPGGPSRDFSATIPPQASNTTVDYYVTATDTTGTDGVLPPGGSSAPFSFRVGPDTTPPVIVHRPLADRPIDAPAWPVDATVTDNLDHGLESVMVRWSRNSVLLDQTQPLAPAGLPRWSGTLPSAGAAIGDSIAYQIVATDSSQARNVARAPELGHYAFRVVNGFGRDFEASDAGFTGNGDWQWGVPALGPPAWSGTHVWGTGIGGSYSDDTDSFLDLGTIDLSTWSNASLVFQHWYKTEPFFDGGAVQASTDDGANWQLIVPSGGYPVAGVQSVQGPGYSGDSHGWQTAEFELSHYIGAPVRLRLRFATDGGVTERGWFVDDLEVVEAQVLSVPLAPRAQDGIDHQVPLAWAPPAGIDPSQPGTPLRGYHVYRASTPDLSDALRLTGTPVTTEGYIDANVVNGVYYFYYVTALYDAGESLPSRVVAGLPYLAEYSSNAAALYMPVPLGGAADTTLTFANPGTGFLNMNVFLGSAEDVSIDALRIQYFVGLVNAAQSGAGKSAASEARGYSGPARTWMNRPRTERPAVLPTWESLRTATKPHGSFAGARPQVPNLSGTSWQLLFTDTQEDSVPDLAKLYATVEGGNVIFKLRGYAPWGNLLTDFNTILGFDVDADRSTGDPQGQDLYCLIGPFALAVSGGAPAIIVPADRSFLDVPPIQNFPVDADSLEVGFSTAFLGGVGNRIYVTVSALSPVSPDVATLIDAMPNPSPTFFWMRPQTLHVSAPAGAPPTPLTLLFPGAVPPGRYQGKIFLETNAPATPVAVIPVTYDFLVTAVEIQDVSLAQEDADVVLRWRTASESDVAAFRVHRSRDGGAFLPLAPDVAPQPGRTYAFRDRDVEPGSYVYRIAEVAADGRVSLHGGAAITVGRQAPLVTFLDAAVPNPFNPTTTLRFGIATAGPARIAVYDARGRLVRTLWRTAQAAPGYQHVSWDGRDDRGLRVASGIYLVHLEAAGRTLTRRLTLVK